MWAGDRGATTCRAGLCTLHLSLNGISRPEKLSKSASLPRVVKSTETEGRMVPGGEKGDLLING